MDISATPNALAKIEAPVDIDVSRVGLAFEDFYRVNADSIARALALTLGDDELAADAANEAMTRAYQRWSKISQYENPAAWVYRVGLNWSLSWKRRRRRERDRPVRLTADTHEISLRDDRFDAALHALSFEHRAVVVCRIFLDWSVDETSQVLGVAPGTIKSRLSRAITELRSTVEIEGHSSC